MIHSLGIFPSITILYVRKFYFGTPPPCPEPKNPINFLLGQFESLIWLIFGVGLYSGPYRVKRFLKSIFQLGDQVYTVWQGVIIQLIYRDVSQPDTLCNIGDNFIFPFVC